MFERIINFLGNFFSITSFFKKNDSVSFDVKSKGNLSINNAEKNIIFSNNEFKIINNDGDKNNESLKTNFSKRLSYVVNEMNKYRRDDNKIILSEIFESIGETSVNVFYQDIEPSIKIYNNVAELLGINKKWFKDGIKQPFFIEDFDKKNISRFIYSDDYSYIEYNDQYIIVINNDALSNVGNQHNALIIQKKNKYKYFIIYDNNEPFELLNPCPGNISYSGCISALRFCDLIYYLKQKQWEDASKYSSSWVKDSSFQDRVYFIDDENFNKLVKGEIYVEVDLSQESRPIN